MQIRWKNGQLPIAIGAIAVVAVTGIVTNVLTRPVIYCYDEGNPEKIYWGAENCLPPVRSQ